YTATTVLSLLREVAQVQEAKIDWNALVKRTKTGITNPREYQMLWRHLAYRQQLIDKLEDASIPLFNRSDAYRTTFRQIGDYANHRPTGFIHQHTQIVLHTVYVMLSNMNTRMGPSANHRPKSLGACTFRCPGCIVIDYGYQPVIRYRIPVTIDDKTDFLDATIFDKAATQLLEIPCKQMFTEADPHNLIWKIAGQPIQFTIRVVKDDRTTLTSYSVNNVVCLQPEKTRTPVPASAFKDQQHQYQ
ncbi:hypothetical protein M8C21_001644, partial [Ambrosia artemisiifolia]